MKEKSKALDKFKELKVESKKQVRRHIKSLRSDRGCEYMSMQFISFLKQHVIYLSLVLQEPHNKIE